MSVDFLLRLLTVVVVLGLFARVWIAMRSRLGGTSTILVLEFSLFVYVITFFLGITAIFLFKEAAIDVSFVGRMYVPPDLPYWRIWLISLLPLGACAIVGGVASHRPRARKAQGLAELNRRDDFLPVALTAGFILLLLGVTLRSSIIDLARNAFDLSYFAAHDLYSQRAQLAAGLSLISAGLIYGTLPCLTTTLILYRGDHRGMMRGLGVAVAVLTILLNLGTFQGGVLTAAGLIFVCAQTKVRRARLLTTRNSIVFAILTGLYLWYQTLKPGWADAPPFTSMIQVFMRMPIATPYLFDLARTHSAAGATLPLAVRLAYYMFPAESVKAFVDVPQPAFIETWYYIGTLGALALLVAVLGGAAYATKILSRLFGQKSRVLEVGILYSVFHFLYYSFQVDAYEMFVSSYGVAFPLIVPGLIVILTRFQHSPIANRRTAELRRRPRPRLNSRYDDIIAP